MKWKPGDRIECDMSFTAHAISDAPDGYIAGIASTPITDLYGHKVLAGAFDESIKKKGLSGPRGVKLLAGHDWHKIAGVIKKLETVKEKLNIEAQLNLNVSYVKDLYEVTKQNGGLNFSVGFMLEEFEFVDDDDEDEKGKKKDEEKDEDDAWLLIKKGDLMEVSVVTFPACLEAEMSFVKHVDTTSEFEKALVASGICRGRNEAHKFALFAKRNVHLFEPKTPVLAEQATLSAHPLLDVQMLKAATDLAVKAKALLGSR